jgi:aminomethyltransferase
MLLRTPLHEFHVAAGAKMVEYAGWDMPLLYRGITEEHIQTRTSGSLFDVSHMGRIHITGADAIPFLDKVLTRNCAQMRVGQSRYSLVCNTAGGVLDDVIVSKHAAHWLVVCNAANRGKILAHFNTVRGSGSFNAEIADQTEATAMIAIQGPKVVELVSEVLDLDVKQIKRYGFENGVYMMSRFTLFRSGYTGEDGVEVVVTRGTAENMVKSLADELADPNSPIKPAGLGARDTLRLEAAMPLYGHELTERTDPISAGLNWAIDLKKDFIGAEPLRVIADRGPAEKLVGLELASPRIARQGTIVKSGPTQIGTVTSGTFGPTLQKSIAMALIDVQHAAEDNAVDIDFRGSAIAARVVPLPFYKKPA